MRFVIIGGSDAGISTALRTHELDGAAHIIVILADAFPSYSICGLRFYLRLSYTPPFSSPWDPVQMAVQAWSRAA